MAVAGWIGVGSVVGLGWWVGGQRWLGRAGGGGNVMWAWIDLLRDNRIKNGLGIVIVEVGFDGGWLWLYVGGPSWVGYRLLEGE